jgi:hypothetical protein
MAVARTRAGAPEGTPVAPPQAAALCAGQAAWLAALPCAAIVLAAIVALGPPLGRALFGGRTVTLWEGAAAQVHPEPTEQARFLIAIAAPLVLLALTSWLLRRAPRLAPTTARTATLAVEAVAVAFGLACLAIQRSVTFGPLYEAPPGGFHQPYFSAATLVVSALGSGALLIALHDRRVRGRLAGWARETRTRRIAAGAVAALATAIWLLHAFNTERTIANAHFAVAYHLQFTLDETAAVLDGRTPLVNFAAQYGFLWPYPVAGAMALLGASVGVFSALMCTISGLAMLAIFGVLRRVTRSALAALGLFLPFLATAFFLLRGPLESRYTFATIYSAYPMRFAGPWLLAWLAARHLSGERPRRAWPLFVVAGLVALNNVDHGVPALGALAAALLWGRWRLGAAALRRLALEALAGLLGALALVSLGTLLRAGSLPHLALMLRFARLFASAGFAMLPMPTLGFHTVVYLTFVAALGVATARAIDRAPDRPLTGMLAWVGTFGLGAGSYYAGRSHPEVLVDAFGTWALAVALLLVVVVRRLAARPSGLPTPAEAACVFGFALAACSLAQTPTPWEQLDRLRQTTAAVYDPPAGQAFVAAHAHRGERVAILMLLGHRMGYALGVADVAPYTGSESMPAVEQLGETVAALRRAGGRKLFLSARTSPEGMLVALRRDGFRLAARGASGAQMWVDGRRG